MMCEKSELITPKLIECGDHGAAPLAMDAYNIYEGTATGVVPPPQEDGNNIANDWLCPDCYERICTLGLDDIRAVCIHCLRELLKPYQKQREKMEKQLRLAMQHYNEGIVRKVTEGSSIRMIAKEDFGSRSPADVEQIIREELGLLERLVEHFAGGDKEVA